MTQCSKRRFDSKIIAGLLLIIIGTLLILDRSNLFYFSLFDIIALVAILGGTIQCIQARHQKDYREGTWWIFFGIWFYISYHQVGGYGFSDTWPLLIIVWGIGHIWKATDKQQYFKPIKE